MVTPEVYPQEAATDGCTVQADVSELDQGSYWNNTYYRLTANDAPGWLFLRFEWVQRFVTNEGTDVSTSYESTSNPTPEIGLTRQSHLFEGWMIVGSFREDDTITSCRAVFGRIGTGIILRSAQSGLILRGSNGMILRDE